MGEFITLIGCIWNGWAVGQMKRENKETVWGLGHFTGRQELLTSRFPQHSWGGRDKKGNVVSFWPLPNPWVIYLECPSPPCQPLLFQDPARTSPFPWSSSTHSFSWGRIIPPSAVFPLNFTHTSIITHITPCCIYLSVSLDCSPQMLGFIVSGPSTAPCRDGTQWTYFGSESVSERSEKVRAILWK